MYPIDIAHTLEQAECLYTEDEVESGLDRLAGQLEQELENAFPLVLCVMLGGLVVTGQLLTRLRFPLQTDYVQVSRYHGDTHGKDLLWFKKPSLPIEGRTVLLVDDILDEGHTLAAITEYCTGQGARQVLSAILVEKKHDRKHPDIKADFVALEVEDRYVFGYGMDYKNHLRHLPGIYAVRDE